MTAFKIKKVVIALLLFPVVYILISLTLTFVPINGIEENTEKAKSIYLNSNGVHLDVVIPKNNLDSTVLDGLRYNENDNYFSFGWGDRDFYLKTPTWADVTFGNSFRALFLNSTSLIHLTRFSRARSHWVKINVNQSQLNRINEYVNGSFYYDSTYHKILLKEKGYKSNDDFYEAVGSFSCFKTCNSWVNTGLKESGIKACLWTPFDFGLLRIHKN